MNIERAVFFMRCYSTTFLKIAVLMIGVPVLAGGIYGGYWIATHPVSSDYSTVLYPIIIGLYVSCIPFYTALFKAYSLLRYIDENRAFSINSVAALRSIKYCAASITMVCVILMPFVYLLAEKDDAPGLILFGLVPVFASSVIGVFAAVLQRLLQDVIVIKSEHDLTV